MGRAQWAQLQDPATAAVFDAQQAQQLRALNEPLSYQEIMEVYVPLSRLINLRVEYHRALQSQTRAFLGKRRRPAPFILGIAGSVAVGKSTTARVLRYLLSRWPSHPRVALVTTDGFLRPNAELEALGLAKRKGFPESYDLKALVTFLADAKAGRFPLQVPTYSHLQYDVLPEEPQRIDDCDILVLEGINVLQAGSPSSKRQLLVSDFFDFSIYVHAEEKHIFRWFLERFQLLRRTAFQDPASFFHRFAQMDDVQAEAFALQVWQQINRPNLLHNIQPTKSRASLVLEKGPDHAVRQLLLRRS